MTVGVLARNLFHQIPANRDYQWGFTLVPVRSANQANEAAKYDYR